VAHACSPSYSGGRGGSQFIVGKWFARPIPKKKKTSQIRVVGMAQSVGPEFKPQYCKNKQTKPSKKKKVLTTIYTTISNYWYSDLFYRKNSNFTCSKLIEHFCSKAISL
jgi:hypothetical protein